MNIIGKVYYYLSHSLLISNHFLRIRGTLSKRRLCSNSPLVVGSRKGYRIDDLTDHEDNASFIHAIRRGGS